MANLRKLGVAMLVYSVPQYVAEDKHRGYNTTHLIKVPQDGPVQMQGRTGRQR